MQATARSTCGPIARLAGDRHRPAWIAAELKPVRVRNAACVECVAGGTTGPWRLHPPGCIWRHRAMMSDDLMLNQVFFEETRDHRRIEIGPYSIDGLAIEVDDPSICCRTLIRSLPWPTSEVPAGSPATAAEAPARPVRKGQGRDRHLDEPRHRRACRDSRPS